VSAPMPKRFAYVEADQLLGVASSLPYAPIMLQMGDRKVQVSALIDSGSTLNVLPFDVGLKLGAVWDEQAVPVRLGGNMAESESARFDPEWADRRICASPSGLRLEQEQSCARHTRPDKLLHGV
jgi:hypothetical protein